MKQPAKKYNRSSWWIAIQTITFVAIIFCLSCTLFGRNSDPADSAAISLKTKISITIHNMTLKDALAEVSRVSGIYLNYNENILPTDLIVSIEYQDAPVMEVLREILSDTPVKIVLTSSGQIVLVNSQQKGIPDTGRKYTISGFVVDAESGETLPGTNIYIEDTHSGCVANVYGFYSLTVPAGIYNLVYSYMGYEIQTIDIVLDQNIEQNVQLKADILSGDTIVVTADIDEDLIETTSIGTIRLTPLELSSIPVLFGEQDVLKTLHLLPGVTLSNEGESGFHVRGGNADQNLVLLDEAPVYNAFHLFGFFSVFNSDAIKNVKLIKGCAPAKYGGSISSVLDIQMNEGNYKEFQGNGGIGSIFSRLTLQGPIVRDKSSYVISGRRTYADIFAHLFADGEIDRSSLYFYDFNLKTNFRLGQNDHLYFSGYFGRDVLAVSEVFLNTWGNKTGTARWNHIFNRRLFLNSSLIFSNFNYSVRVEPEENSDEGIVETENNINAITAKGDFQYFFNTQSTFNFGFQYVLYDFLPGNYSSSEGFGDFILQVGKRTAAQYAAYLSHELDALTWLKIHYGLRYSQFAVDRLSDAYDFADPEGVPKMYFRTGETVTYGGLEPRFSANIELNNSTSVKLGYARSYQNIHLLSNSTPGTPINVWQPSSSRVKPQYADQISIGLYKDMHYNTYNLSCEVFYKNMNNQVDFKNGANIIISTLFESDLVFGRSRTYGIEFLLRKRSGNLTGWIGYSLAKAQRYFSEINQGMPFPPKFDRTHDVSLVMTYRINKKWTFSANWVYFTGNAITIPYGKYLVNGQIINVYSPRNAFRMPDYHRLDVNFTYTTNGGNTWNFSLYNAYGRRNAYALLFRNNQAMPLRVSLFSFVPSITYNFKF